MNNKGLILCQNTRNSHVIEVRVIAHVKFYSRVSCVYFACKSAILHGLYAHVSAAIPLASTVVVQNLIQVQKSYSSEVLTALDHL